jgi:hypothetical protein
MAPTGKVIVASILVLVLAGLSAVGAPPSERSENAGAWRKLEPLMLPALSAGVVLSAIALIAGIVGAFRGGAVAVPAVLCVAASFSSMLGIAIAASLDAREGMYLQMGLMAAFFAVPVLASVEAMRQARQGQQRNR